MDQNISSLQKLQQNVSPRPTSSALDLRQSMQNRGRIPNDQSINIKRNNLTMNNFMEGTLPQLNDKLNHQGMGILSATNLQQNNQLIQNNQQQKIYQKGFSMVIDQPAEILQQQNSGNQIVSNMQNYQSFNRTYNKPKSAIPNRRNRIRQQFSPTNDLQQANNLNASLNVSGFQGTTIQHLQRVNNIGVSENAINLNFETRIKEIYNARESSVKLNPKVIETWINETLLDAEHLDIPGVILKPEHKNPISRYQIDRLTLTNAGIPNEFVDRIYRGLFVYSIGFYEMLQKSLHHAENRYSLLSSLWKVFAILLEYCCKSNYQMLISKISKEHKEELEKLEQQFHDQVNRMTENERNLKENLESLQQRKDELEKQKEEETFLRRKIEEEFTKNVQTHEEEVQLRLKFESKLNNMHALHRDLQAKYQRSLEDIYQLETQNHTFSKLVSDQKAELIELRSEKVENESKIVYQAERIKQLIQENELKLRQINDLEIKLSRANSDLEQKSLSLKNAEKQVNEMRLKIDANRALIEGLTSEKNHLELSLKENKDQKEQYKEKCDRLQSMHEQVFQEMQEYKKQLVGIQEIKKDRDDRIEKLREEFESVTKNFDTLDKEHTALKVHHDHISEEYDMLKMDFQSVSEKLRLSNKVRNEKEEQLNDKIIQNNQLTETIKDRDYQIEKNRKEIDKLSKRLQDVERQNDSLEIKKKSLDKQSEIQRKQLLDKIQNLNELVSAEKDTREMWINRYEREQKQHIATNTDLLSTKGLLQDCQLKIKNLEIIIESLQKSRDQTKDSNEDLQNNLTGLIAKNETLERDLFTKTELLKTVEEQNKLYVQKLREEYDKLQQHLEYTSYCKDIEYEDLRSYTRKLFEGFDLQKMNIDSLNDNLKQMTELKETLQIDIAKLQQEHEELNIKFNNNTDQLRKEIDRNGELDYQVQQYSRQIDQMHEEIEDLEKKIEENKAIEQQNNIMVEKIKLLEATLEMGEDGGKRLRGNLMNRGIQTKKPKQKERNIQTDVQPAYMQQQVLFTTTQASTKNSASNNKKPRIASAANTNSTMGMSGPNLMRDVSQGMASTLGNSQGDLYFHEGINIGSGTNILDYDRVIKSAAQKYRHMVPSTEAIMEEEGPENNQSKVGGMFKRNHNMDDDDDNQDPRLPIKKTATDYIYESVGANSKQGLYLRQDSGARVMSGQSQPITALQKHQQASRLRGLNVGAAQEASELFKKQHSTHSSRRSGEHKDDATQDVLQSVYEKRVSSSGVQRQGFKVIQQNRPVTVPDQNLRNQSGLFHAAGYISNGNDGTIETVFTPSDASHLNRLKQDNQQYQQNLMSHTSSNFRQNNSKSNDRFVKGKPSIKTLIKVATARDN